MLTYIHCIGVMEPSIPFHKRFKFVDAEDITNKKIRNIDLPPENNNVASKPASQKISPATDDSIPENNVYTNP